MATITYDGVASADGGGGNIFKDVKFWIAQRVPMRTDLINKVKQNGGTVVPLEKQADILIADHARKDAPKGSYSWRFIADSVKNGIIQVTDKYRIGPSPATARPVGSGALTRGKRVPFTKEDDAQLTRWVLAHLAEQLGNKIYQEWERKNPRHTWQSWRDRWIKRLKVLDQDQLEKIAASAPEEVEEEVEDSEEAEETIMARSKKNPKPQKETSQRSASQKQSRQERPEGPPAVRQGHTEKSTRTRSPSIENPVPKIQSPPQQDIQQTYDEEVLRDSDSDAVRQEEEKRELFYFDYATFLDINEVTQRHVAVNGQAIELYDLLIAAEESLLDTPDDAHDWHRVAESLGFHNPGDDIAEQLLAHYDEHLKEFLDGLASFDAEDDAEGGEQLDLQNNPPHAEDVDIPPSSQMPQSDVPSSPPVRVSGRKRATDSRPVSSSGAQAKRPRLTRDTVIPSTPDVELERVYPTTRGLPRNFPLDDNVADSEASQQLPPLPRQTEGSIDLSTRTEEPQHQRRVLATENGTRSVDVTPLQDDMGPLMDLVPIPFALSSKSRQRQAAAATSRQSPPPRYETRTNPSIRSQEHSHGGPRSAVKATALTGSKPKPKPPANRRSLPATFTASRRKSPSPPPPLDLPSDPEEPESNSRQIQDWITYYQNRGYPRSLVVEGLQCTTLTPGPLAELAMRSLKNKEGIPSHHEGIWTARDDAQLLWIMKEDEANRPPSHSSHPKYERYLNRLHRKHGQQGVELRRGFLAAQQEENDGHAGR